MTHIDQSKIRNFCIVAHIDHGKSTLADRIIEKTGLLTSREMQAQVLDNMELERERGITIYSKNCSVMHGDVKINIVDTPGHADFSSEVERIIKTVDTVILLVDSSEGPMPQTRFVLKKSLEQGINPILLINKIDKMQPDEFAEIYKEYEELGLFEEIIGVSAKEGTHVENVIKEVAQFMEEGPMYFPDDMITDQPERQIVAEIIREKMLWNLEREIPHGTAVEITKFSERDDGVIEIDATIYCEKASHKGIIIGKQGAMLKKISTMARQDCERFLGAKIYLQTWVKVKENWRDNPNLIRNFGYHQDR